MDGRALVPEDYIREMSRKQSEPPAEMSDYGYGWQCWLWARRGRSCSTACSGRTSS